MEFLKDMKRIPCHDCGCKVGENHIPGCDTERCPKCNRQLIGCDCFLVVKKKETVFDEKAFSKYTPEKWSGIMYEDAIKYCEENDLYVYFDNDISSYIDCDKTHPEATHDINTAVRKMMK